jgi:imidazolonepropionase
MTTRRKDDAPSALLLTNIRQLVTLRGESVPRRGPELGQLGIIEDAAVLCSGGKIVAVGSKDEATSDDWLKAHKRDVAELDCSGAVVVPGFVDSHTHPVFTAPRLNDFEQRIAGSDYETVAEKGGGIRGSVSGVREATAEELAAHVSRAFAQMSAQGTTTIEAKSGYGLTVKDELKSLEAIDIAEKEFPGTVRSTLLGAHVLPKDYLDDREGYIRLVCEKMIPQAAERDLAHFVDVFIERGAFTVEEAEHIFTAAWEHGLGVRAHFCQLGKNELGDLLKFGPASLDHLDFIRNDDVPTLAASNTIATLLPGAVYFLGRSQYPPARKLIDAGVAVALATDFNPGSSPTASMPMVLSLACTQMRMSPAEAIAAATINAACALRLQERKGSVEPGKDADLAIFDVDDYREIPYWFGGNRCAGVVIGGELYQPNLRAAG